MKIARRPGLGVCLGVLLLTSICAVSHSAVSAAEPPADGSGCLNIVNTAQGSTAPSGVSQANVCNYINNKPLGNPANAFYPKAQAQVISTFSFAMPPPYMVSTKPVAPCPQNNYAGCMTR